MSTAVLTLTRGLPGSGKTTWALAQVAAHPGTVRVNRDDLRAMLRPHWPHGDQMWEQLVTTIQYNTISVLLCEGLHVICDDTNLHPDTVANLTYLATCSGAKVHLRDFTHLPVDVCVARDAARPQPVGAQTIQRMWADYLATVQRDAGGVR